VPVSLRRRRRSACPCTRGDHHPIFEGDPQRLSLRGVRIVIRVPVFLAEREAAGRGDLHEHGRLFEDHPGQPQALDNLGFGHGDADQGTLAGVDGRRGLGTGRQGECAQQQAQEEETAILHGRDSFI
jgi:hypothetical protein